MIEVEHVERKVRRRHTERGELGHVQPVALFLADRAVNLGRLVAIARAVPVLLDPLGGAA